jgi:CheY-like chemotaxis protein
MLVLVVEDHADAREMLAFALRLEGFETVTAGEGAEALAVARRAQPCAIVLDVMLPGLDGFGFRAQQQQDCALSHIPVVCVTAYHDATEVRERIRPTHILPKPCSVMQLASILRALCPERRR